MSLNTITNDLIREVFLDEVRIHRGDHERVFENDRVLIIRCLLPQVQDVAPRDEMRNGIAISATSFQIDIMPFMLRKVCRNGAVLSYSLESTTLDRLETDVDWSRVELRKAVENCCNPALFANNVNKIGQSRNKPINKALNMMHYLAVNSNRLSTAVARLVIERMLSEDPTEYGVMNAVTSVARDSDDERVRWNLQVLGGKIGMGKARMPASADFSDSLLARAGVSEEAWR